MRVLATVWVSAVVVAVIVRVPVSHGVGAVVHPWPVWLAPPGAVLGVLYATGVGRAPLRRLRQALRWPRGDEPGRLGW